MNNKPIRVMVGLSGGVDSAVAAYLLKQQGYDVIAGFMRNWDALANSDQLGNPTLTQDIFPQEVDYIDAQHVAAQLNIPLFRIDFVKEYWDHVFSFFLKEYLYGSSGILLSTPVNFSTSYVLYNFVHLKLILYKNFSNIVCCC
jgi:tRNA-specific 2-thiouridylase